MTLIEHLSELRSRLFKAAIFVAAGTVAGWILYSRLLEILKHPYCALPPARRFNSGSGECQLVFFSVGDGFMIRLKVAAPVPSDRTVSPQAWGFFKHTLTP